MKYEDFINSKRHLLGEFGFKPNYYPDIAFDFQKHIIERAIKKGRIAVFADTGLGKTLIQLSIAKNIVNETNKRVLILTPLAVGFQFVKEAEKIGIEDVYQTMKGELNGKIIVCNYERLHYLNPNDFIGCILDESSILKNFDGKIKRSNHSFY
jgi:superfamily II DNA or RNA helicase